MQNGQGAPDTYFDTRARAERLQLLLHLVRNAGDVIYLRAPAGAGKTRFARRLLEILGDDMATVWIRAVLDRDVPAAAADQLGLSPEDAAHWPDGLLDAIGEQELLLVVDDADQLDLPSVERLAAMHLQGGRLLLLGHGGLAQTTRDWDVQFVDLPPFDAAETRAFLRARAGQAADRINEDLAAALHHAAQGWPGPLLDALEEVLVRSPRKKAAALAPAGHRPAPWIWLAGGAVVVALAAVLVLQDEINAIFEPEAEAGGPTTGSEVAPRLTGPADPVATPRPGPLADPFPASLEEPPADLALSGVMPPPPVAAPTETEQPAPEAAAADGTAGIVGEDPLEAVMRDALEAAQAAATVRPDADAPGGPVEGPGATPSPVPADRPGEAAETAPPAAAQSPVEPAAVESTAAEPAAGEPAEPGGLTSSGPAPVQESPAEAPDSPSRAETRLAAPSLSPSLPPAGAGAGSAVVPGPVTRPAPVEERVVQAEAKAATPPATSKTASPAATVAETAGGDAWLKGRPPGHYTLQLVGARDRAGVLKFVRRQNIAQPYAIFERQLDGRPWYSLVAGDYPDRAAAVAARDRLSNGVQRAGVWPRTFESIFESQR